MGIGRKKDREKQQDPWVACSEIVSTRGHLFYERLNQVLNAEKFHQGVEAMCRKYYKSSSGQPSITPGEVPFTTGDQPIINLCANFGKDLAPDKKPKIPT